MELLQDLSALRQTMYRAAVNVDGVNTTAVMNANALLNVAESILMTELASS